MSTITLENVTKRYGDFTALDGVSLEIATASFTSVFGPPGSGKSVLLRVLLGLEPVDEGRILIDGKDLTTAAPKERNLGMVFQNLALFPHLTAQENIAFPLQRRGVARSEIDSRIDAISGVLSIGHILHKKPAALSGGERQRVAIGRALVRDAGAYLMDEPIAALDARLRDAMRVELRRLQSELGQTFIYVTHDCDEAMSVADTMAILEHGRVAQIGPPDLIYADPASLYVAELVGAPRLSVLDATVDEAAVHFAMGHLPLEQARMRAPSTGNVKLAIRPEAVRIQGGSDAMASARIEDVERLGAFSIVTLADSQQTLRAIAPGDTAVHVDDRVGFSVDPEGILLFGPTDGARLY